jgi:hypothetical protein
MIERRMYEENKQLMAQCSKLKDSNEALQRQLTFVTDREQKRVSVLLRVLVSAPSHLMCVCVCVCPGARAAGRD